MLDHLLVLNNYVNIGMITEYNRPDGTTTFFPADGHVITIETYAYYGTDVGRVQSIDLDVEGNLTYLSIKGDIRSLEEDPDDDNTWGLSIKVVTAADWHREERRNLVHRF